MLILGLASVPGVRRGISYLLVWLLLNLVNTDATWTSLNNESRERIAARGGDVREGFLWLKDFTCIDRLKGYRTIKTQCQGYRQWKDCWWQNLGGDRGKGIKVTIWELTWTLNLKWRKTLHLLHNKRMKTLISQEKAVERAPRQACSSHSSKVMSVPLRGAG